MKPLGPSKPDPQVLSCGWPIDASWGKGPCRRVFQNLVAQADDTACTSAVTHPIFYFYFLLALLRPDLVSETLSSLLIYMQCNLIYCIRVASFARLECYFVSHSLPRHLAVVHVYHPLGAPDFKQRSETRVHSKYWNLLTPPPPP